MTRYRFTINKVENFIFGRASNLYLCLYNQIFALFHYVFIAQSGSVLCTEPDWAMNTSPTQRKHNLNNTHAAA